MTYDITSAANDRIKWLVRLREREHRDAEGVFLVEGERLYARAIESGLSPRVTFTDGTTATSGATVTVKPAVLDRASYRKRSQRVIGVFPQLGTDLAELRLPDEPLLLIAENIEKPGNFGAMLRTASAAGVDAVITVGSGVDIHNPNTVRASTGALFTTPVAVSTWVELTPWLSGHGIRQVGASPAGDVSMWDADLTGALALAIGAEDEGLSPDALRRCDPVIAIPQTGTVVDSLNVSVAAAVLVFEARRQRSRHRR